MEVTVKPFENYQGQTITQVRLKNNQGVEISCLSQGATWYEFLVPNKAGGHQNLLMNFDHCAAYYTNGLCCCQSIGRVAGRIKQGQFNLNNKLIQLPTNENGNTLHGGDQGFRFLNWDFSTEQSSQTASVMFTKKIEAQVDGFPGDCLVHITYTLDNQNKVTLTFTAENGPEATLFNPTCHVYFNFSDRPDLSTHELKINSTQHLQLDSELIPTGQMCANAKTPYDFSDFQNLQTAIQANQGFDDAFVIAGSSQTPRLVASLRETTHGRQVNLLSESNGLIMYTMSQQQPGISFKRDHGALAQPSEAVALEAQMLPDAINHPNFGDIVLPANATRKHQIIFVLQQN